MARPTTIFALLIGILADVLTRLDWERERITEKAGIVIGAIGVIVTALSGTALGDIAIFGGNAAPLFGAGIALSGFGLVFSRSRVRTSVSYSRLVGGAVIGVALAAGVAVLGAMSFGPFGLTQSVMSQLPFFIPLFMLLPAGYAYGRESRRLAVGAAAGGFALSILPLVYSVSPSLGIGVLLVPLALVYGGIIVVVVGAPLFVVAASYASPISKSRSVPIIPGEIRGGRHAIGLRKPTFE